MALRVFSVASVFSVDIASSGIISPFSGNITTPEQQRHLALQELASTDDHPLGPADTPDTAITTPS